MNPGLKNVAARIFNTPLMILPQKMDAIVAGLGGRFGLSEEDSMPDYKAVAQVMGVEVDEVQRDIGAFSTLIGERRRPGHMISNGIAVIDIFGLLAHRGSFTADSSYILGYQDIARMFDAAMNDDAVKGILLNIDSPGGEVQGAFELANIIYKARGQKPIKAVMDGLAASAGYLIASAAEEISVSPTSYGGSVGVYMRHVDISGYLENEGLKVTQIFSGDHKADGNSFEPLPKAVYNDLKADVDKLRTLFVDTVALYRDMSSEDVRATEARVYLGAEIIEKGLADRVETTDEAVLRMSASNETADSNRAMAVHNTEEELTMSNVKDKTASGDAVQTNTEGQDKQNYSAGAGAERGRISAILSHDSAKGREAAAQNIALNTDMSVEQAGALLETLPKVSAENSTKGGSEFASHMAKVSGEDIPATISGDTQGEEDPNMSWVRSIERVHGKRLQ